MKTNSLRTLATLAALALLAPLGMVQAQDIQLASHAEMNDLYARLAELESRVAASNVSGCGCADAASNGCGCDDGCDDCCGCPGWIAGAEILILEPFSSLPGAAAGFDAEEGYRLWLGYQGAGGLGIRARYFDYFQRATAASSIDINAFDVEVYDAFQLGCNWDFNLGGGLRTANFSHQFVAGAAGASRFWGTGPIVSAELYRHIGDQAALYGIVRESLLAGDGRTPGGALIDGSEMMVSEIQLGIQVHRDYNDGLLFARAGWEAQRYDMPAGPGFGEQLQGITFSFGVMR